jgi:hypothetical protein
MKRSLTGAWRDSVVIVIRGGHIVVIIFNTRKKFTSTKSLSNLLNLLPSSHSDTLRIAFLCLDIPFRFLLVQIFLSLCLIEISFSILNSKHLNSEAREAQVSSTVHMIEAKSTWYFNSYQLSSYMQTLEPNLHSHAFSAFKQQKKRIYMNCY